MQIEIDLPTAISHWATVYKSGLFDDVLPFWIRHGVDRECGGFLTSLDRDGSLLDSDKAVWQQGRFTWLLAKLYNTIERNNEWLELAEHGVRFLESRCFDPEDGRMWFHLTREGEPIRKRRYAFSEAFAAMAFGECARATDNGLLAERAQQVFQAFREHDPNHSGPSKFTSVRPMKSIGKAMITINVAQQLRSSIDLPGANGLIDDMIQEIERDYIKSDIACVMETAGEGGTLVEHFDGRTLNPGHAIEAAWFILQEGKHRRARRFIDLGCRMLDWMWARGWDSRYGGIFYFCSVDDRPVQEYWHDMKFWWPQCESLIATLMAYQLTGDVRYVQSHALLHDWTYRNFPDAEHGEWFGYLHRDGSLSSSLKGNFWKGPFHIPRMQLICWKLAEELLISRGDTQVKCD